MFWLMFLAIFVFNFSSNQLLAMNYFYLHQESQINKYKSLVEHKSLLEDTYFFKVRFSSQEYPDTILPSRNGLFFITYHNDSIFAETLHQQGNTYRFDEILRFNHCPSSICFSHDARDATKCFIAFVTKHSVCKVINITNGEEYSLQHEFPLMFSLCNDYFLSSCKYTDSAVKLQLHNLDTYRVSSEALFLKEKLFFSSKGYFLYERNKLEDSTTNIDVYSINTGIIKKMFSISHASLKGNAHTFSPDASRVSVFNDACNQITIWNTRTGNCASCIESALSKNQKIRQALFTPDNKHFILLVEDQCNWGLGYISCNPYVSVKIWNINKKWPSLTTITTNNFIGQGASCITVDNKFIYLGNGTKIERWDIKNGMISEVRECHRPLTKIWFSEDGLYFFARTDSDLWIWHSLLALDYEEEKKSKILQLLAYYENQAPIWNNQHVKDLDKTDQEIFQQIPTPILKSITVHRQAGGNKLFDGLV